jgi:glutamine synthetase
MGLLAWLTRWTTPPAAPGRVDERATPGPAADPVAAMQARLRAKILGYRRQAAAQAAADQRRREQADQERQRRLGAEWEDELAQMLALRNSHFPGDTVAQERAPERLPSAFEEQGGWWIRW